MKHALLIGAFLAVTLAACGKKGPLDPPTPREQKEKPAR